MPTITRESFSPVFVGFLIRFGARAVTIRVIVDQAADAGIGAVAGWAIYTNSDVNLDALSDRHFDLHPVRDAKGEIDPIATAAAGVRPTMRRSLPIPRGNRFGDAARGEGLIDFGAV